MNKTPLLSICIPTYNRWKILLELVDSIIAQEWFNETEIEIVISNNASNDNTGDLIRVRQRDYSNILYFCNNQNIWADRNVLEVLRKWNWKYLWCLSDDDVILHDWLKRVIEVLKNIDDDILFIQTNFSWLNQNLTIYKESFIGSWLKTRVFNNLHDLYKSYNYYHFGLTFLSTHIFSSQIQLFDFENIPLTHIPHSCIAWLVSRSRVFFINNDIVGYRPYNSSANMKDFLNFFQIFVIGHYRYMNFLRKNNAGVSQFKLLLILIKMFLYSLYVAIKSVKKSEL